MREFPGEHPGAVYRRARLSWKNSLAALTKAGLIARAHPRGVGGSGLTIISAVITEEIQASGLNGRRRRQRTRRDAAAGMAAPSNKGRDLPAIRVVSFACRHLGVTQPTSVPYAQLAHHRDPQTASSLHHRRQNNRRRAPSIPISAPRRLARATTPRKRQNRGPQACRCSCPTWASERQRADHPADPHHDESRHDQVFFAAVPAWPRTSSVWRVRQFSLIPSGMNAERISIAAE